MAATSNQRSPWFGVASCAIALVAIVVIAKTTTFHAEGLFGSEQTSLNAGLDSDLDEWVWLLLGALVAGGGLAVVELRREGEPRWVAWMGLALNALLVVLIVVFLVLAFGQGAFRT